METYVYRVGWDHPATRRAWRKSLARATVWFICWTALVPGTLVLGLTAPAWTACLFGPLMILALHRVVVQLSHVQGARRSQRILRQYPWQRLRNVPYGLKKHAEASADKMWWEFANPAEPGQRIPLLYLKPCGSYWWLMRMRSQASSRRKAEIEELWFAGDPRFFGVIAVSRAPGGDEPKRLHVLFQDWAYHPETSANPYDIGYEDMVRALDAGARQATT